MHAVSHSRLEYHVRLFAAYSFLKVIEIRSKRHISALQNLNRTIQEEFILLESSTYICCSKLKSIIAGISDRNSSSKISRDGSLPTDTILLGKNQFLDALDEILIEMDSARIRERVKVSHAFNNMVL
jgi:hypothetical protein